MKMNDNFVSKDTIINDLNDALNDLRCVREELEIVTDERNKALCEIDELNESINMLRDSNLDLTSQYNMYKKVYEDTSHEAFKLRCALDVIIQQISKKF